MRRNVLLGLWLLTDVLLFIASYALAYFLRVGFILSTDFPFRSHITVATLVSAPWLVVLLTTRTFGLTRSQTTLKNGAYIFYSSVVGNALFALTYYFAYGLFFSRLLLVEALILSTAAIWIWHILFEILLRMLLQRNPPTFPTLIVGVTRESKRLISLLKKRRNPLKPVAILDGAGAKEKEIDGVPVVGKLNLLEDVLRTYRVTHLIQCSDLEQSLNLLSACRSHGITYILLPSVLGIVERDERIESLEGCAVTMVSPRQRKWMWFFA